MAYLGGNAIYIAHTNNRVEDFVDYRNMCGVGVVVQDNHFVGNVGLKRHNGGASLHHCIYYEDSTSGYAGLGHTSSLKLGLRDKNAEDEGEYLFYYDDPLLATADVTDLFDPTKNYTVQKYGTQIVGNNFTHNYSGMKGSAVAAIRLSSLKVSNNCFMENGPVTSMSEIEYSPYYKYLAKGSRTLSMNLEATCG